VSVYPIACSRTACCLLLLGVAVVSGCDDLAAPPESVAEDAAQIGQDFDAATAGEIRGCVTWQGAIPQVPSYRSPLSPGNEHAGQPRQTWPNPHVPHIDPPSKGIAGAVVFLRDVPARRARPWDHPSVRVELRDYQIHVCQGDHDGASGFVRRGEAITLVSRQAIFHSLRVRGAAFFARTFPDADQPCTQRLDRAGLVELTSGCGYFWMCAHLFVADHPYYTHTDSQGHFVLPRVPPGRYELVAWLPDWHEAQRELDAETALICRLTFRPPFEATRSIDIAPRQVQHVSLSLSAANDGR
jgi:hypothetical protein